MEDVPKSLRVGGSIPSLATTMSSREKGEGEMVAIFSFPFSLTLPPKFSVSPVVLDPFFE
jgi:hypothetical protein